MTNPKRSFGLTNEGRSKLAYGQRDASGDEDSDGSEMVACRTLLAVVLATAVFALSSGALAHDRPCHVPPLVSRALEADRRSPDAAHVWDLREKLWYFEANVARRCLAVIVPQLVEMLHDDNDVVRSYAADALGELRLAARSAVPDIEQALKDETCGASPCAGRTGSAAEIGLALMIIATPGKDPYLFLAPTAQRRSCRDVVRRLQSLRDDFKAPSATPPYDAGRKLAHYTTTVPGRCKRAVLPLLIATLHDPDDLARLYAAEAIGYLGAAARSAVPALEQALKLDKCVCLGSDCMKGSWSSTSAIDTAMIEITGSEGDPAMYECAYSGSAPAGGTDAGRSPPASKTVNSKP